MTAFPKTRRRELFGLVALVLKARMSRGDVAEALSEWLGRMTRQYESPNIVIDLVARRALFVSDPALSRHVLNAAPSPQNFVAGTMKRKAMSFLAPNALTILDGDRWRAFRTFNEEVLQPGRPHVHLAQISSQVEQAFRRPIESIGDTRRRMGQVMLAAVFGVGTAPESLVADIQDLFAEVNVRTAVFGSRKGARRDAFRRELHRLWNDAAASRKPGFLALAHEAANRLAHEYRREDLLLDQIPHWMFTFTNSGSDLLVRSLALILARPASLARVEQEIASVKRLDDSDRGPDLRYLRACIREAGRLFPPVVLTTHRAPRDHVFEGTVVEAGTEILQYFPFTNRDLALDPDANNFRPERWLDPDDPIHARDVNTFLSGARSCPGQDIILFVVESAIAELLRNGGMQPKPSRLGEDPLPFSFTKPFYPF